MKSVLFQIFRPLAKLGVARGVLFQEAAEMLKRAYLAAARDLSGDSPATGSRLSVMTGLQRRDIQRLGAAPEADAPRLNHVRKLIHLWHSAPEFGPGAPLPRHGPTGSFDALARAVRQDVHPRTLLDQLLGLRVVAEDAGTGAIRPLTKADLPEAGSEEQLDYLARHLADHGAAAVANVLGQGPRHFDRSLHLSGLSAAAVQTLRDDYEEAQMALFEDLRRRAAELKSEDPGPCRARFGGYDYSEEQSE